jgi:hypothetical protein
MKSLTTCENPSSNDLYGACSGFPTAACDSKKIVFKAAAMSVLWRKPTNESEGKTLKEIRCSFWNNLQFLVSVFKEASRNFILIFLFNKTG